MKILLSIVLILCVVFPIESLQAQESEQPILHRINIEEINKLEGEWSGNLTYIDYNSGKPYSMPCSVSIESKRTHKKLMLRFSYPNEPKANNKEIIKISKDGSLIDNNKIVSKTMLDDIVTITTESFGKDGNQGRNARIKTMYSIGENTLVIRKEVNFEDSEGWIMRNEYKFERS